MRSLGRADSRGAGDGASGVQEKRRREPGRRGEPDSLRRRKDLLSTSNITHESIGGIRSGKNWPGRIATLFLVRFVAFLEYLRIDISRIRATTFGDVAGYIHELAFFLARRARFGRRHQVDRVAAIVAFPNSHGVYSFHENNDVGTVRAGSWTTMIEVFKPAYSVQGSKNQPGLTVPVIFPFPSATACHILM